MCLIIYKPANETIPDYVIESGCRKNPDGAGIMFRDDSGEVISRKGFFINGHSQEVAVRKWIEEVGNRELALHFRMGTHGNLGQEHSHPFEIVPGMYLMHNGIISGFGAKPKNKTRKSSESSNGYWVNGVWKSYGSYDSVYDSYREYADAWKGAYQVETTVTESMEPDKSESDTAEFVRLVLNPIVTRHPDIVRDPVFLWLIGEVIGVSKFLILDKKGFFGLPDMENWVKHGGVILSNTYAWTDATVIPANLPAVRNDMAATSGQPASSMPHWKPARKDRKALRKIRKFFGKVAFIQDVVKQFPGLAHSQDYADINPEDVGLVEIPDMDDIAVSAGYSGVTQGRIRDDGSIDWEDPVSGTFLNGMEFGNT